ncbi:DBH-like monooxygenase protein 1 homolog [Corticium candelabrum]|uniref:DBH-like monooxygenase protein 1 homolog n=1 Tax=Corticium candelabrum TaxID=121492 RepID=UPI002E26F971|nr:DBH-like monooxygenase protein 1 homolog [Corticium candelabrum]
MLSLFASYPLTQSDQTLCPSDCNDRSQYLDGSVQKYLLCWKVDWTNNSITFSARVATTGWIGLGFSPTGFMTNSDVVIGWVKSGKAYLTDRFATSRALPQVDKTQNVELLEAYESNKTTVIKFRRNLAACEPKDHSIEQGTTRVIFAYHMDDPQSETSVPKHKVSGRVSVNLLSGTGNLKPAALESDHHTIDLLNSNVSVPTRDTTYWCSPFQLPLLQNESHIIRFEPVVQANHEQLVHHILLYQCTDVIRPFLDMSWDCDNPSASIPSVVRACRRSSQIAAWAVGGKGLSFPANVGLPLSGNTGVQYVLMETHYNNERLSNNTVDSSGIRIYYTNTKRQYDGAVVQIGHTVSLDRIHLLLPPGRDDIVLENVCPGACTRKGLPTGGISVFATFLHSHNAGKAIRIKHLRNSTELPDLDRNDNYDFNFQDTVLLEKEVKILPGDDLQLFCEYHTSNRQSVTIGGEGTRDEMCLGFLFVYPRPQIGKCLSQLPTSLLLTYLNNASKNGWLPIPDNINASNDQFAQYLQLVKGVEKMVFPNASAYDLWSQSYWSSEWREYQCSGIYGNGLLGPIDVFNVTSLPVITNPRTSTVSPESCIVDRRSFDTNQRRHHDRLRNLKFILDCSRVAIGMHLAQQDIMKTSMQTYVSINVVDDGRDLHLVPT